MKCFPSTLGRRNLETQQSPVILDLCLGRPRSGKSRGYRDVIVSKRRLRFQNDFRPRETPFQIPPDRKAFSKTSVFETDWCCLSYKLRNVFCPTDRRRARCDVFCPTDRQRARCDIRVGVKMVIRELWKVYHEVVNKENNRKQASKQEITRSAFL